MAFLQPVPTYKTYHQLEVSIKFLFLLKKLKNTINSEI